MASLVKRGTRANPKWYVKHQPAGAPGFQRLLPGIVTKKEADDELARIRRDLAAGRDPFPEPVAAPSLAGELMERWRDGLTNRNAADDRSRINAHLIPRFGKMRISQIDLPAVMLWLDDLAQPAPTTGEAAAMAAEQATANARPRAGAPKKANKAPRPPSGQTQRHLLNLLSRFFAWAIERGLATLNPVRSIPQGKRPKGRDRADQPWLEDESKVPALIERLGPIVGLMFYLGNRSGMRLGEICGLTLGDLDFVSEGVIRVAHSYGGPLKEDKDNGKVKWVPAPIDFDDMMGLHLKRRKLQGAKATDLVFPFTPAKPQNRRRTSTWTGYRKEFVEACWEKAAKECEVDLGFYAATRHSFVSRCLKNGASLDETSAAVGHSSPVVTRRFYDHFVRKTFSPVLRAGVPNAFGAES